MEPELKGKVAMITGAARGMGRSHAVTLAAAGADIVLAGTDTRGEMREACEQVEAQGATALPVAMDVRDRAQIASAVETATNELGKIDVLVSNAGIGDPAPFVDLSDDDWDAVIGVNLTGAANCIRAVLPGMVDRGYGRIVATSSFFGKRGATEYAHYVASKWGVIGLVKSVALEFATQGITANVVCPGIVNTPMLHREEVYRNIRPDLENPTREDVEQVFEEMSPMPVPWIEPEEVSNAVLFLVSPRANFISGVALDVAHGISAQYSA